MFPDDMGECRYCSDKDVFGFQSVSIRALFKRTLFVTEIHCLSSVPGFCAIFIKMKM